MESMRDFSDRIADSLASGSVPWREIPAELGLPLRFDGRPFGGASVLSLWMVAEEKGFERPTWLSRQRIDELGGRLMEGATPATAFVGGRRPRRQPGPAGRLATVEEWRAADVWCVDEIDGLASHLYRGADELRRARHSPVSGIDRGRDGRFGAFIETLDGWEGTEALTAGAEAEALVRWTASPARMNRDVARAGEGLVTEIGAAALLAECGLATHALGPARLDAADAWAETVAMMRDDERVVFRVARDATDAVEWLRRRAPGYRQFAAAVSGQMFRADSLRGSSVGGVAGEVLADPGMVAGSAVPARVTDELAALLAARRARRVTGEALGFRHRPVPAGDDGGAWRATAASLIRDVADLDLETPRVRAAVEAEVAVAAARPADVVSAERFVADFRDVTHRRVQMADLTAQHTRAMSVGEVAIRL